MPNDRSRMGIAPERYELRELRVAGLPATLRLPPHPEGLVVFAHGSGSSRMSPRNNRVAEALSGAGFATLLLDLLTPQEAEDRAHVFDIGLLAARLLACIDSASAMVATRGLPVGLFGASTGAAAALVAARSAGPRVGAVVSRGGRPDLAGAVLPRVQAPVLLIVGGNDPDVLRMNREALALLPGPRALEVVPGATHLFEEPGALETVTTLALGWFRKHLVRQPQQLRLRDEHREGYRR